MIDAWRIETFAPRAQGAAMAAYVWGYRVALLVSGAGVIAASKTLGWAGALGLMAGLMALAPLLTLAAPEPVSPRVAALVADRAGRFFAGLRGAVLVPLRDLLARPGAPTILGFVALFKLGEAMAGVMTAPFYTHLGFDRAAIAVANGPLALACAFAGTALGGFLVARLGVGRALLATGWVQTLTMGMYLVLAASAGRAHVLVATVAIEAFAEGMADAAFITYLSGLCAPGVHRDAIRAAVVAGGDRAAHGGRAVGVPGRGDGLDRVLCAGDVRRPAGDGADATAVAPLSAGRAAAGVTRDGIGPPGTDPPVPPGEGRGACGEQGGRFASVSSADPRSAASGDQADHSTPLRHPPSYRSASVRIARTSAAVPAARSRATTPAARIRRAIAASAARVAALARAGDEQQEREIDRRPVDRGEPDRPRETREHPHRRRNAPEPRMRQRKPLPETRRTKRFPRRQRRNDRRRVDPGGRRGAARERGSSAA